MKQDTRLSHIVHLKHISDEGVLSIAEVGIHIPFQIARFYIISNVNDQAVRGKHAHFHNQQYLFCLKGTISILLDTGKERETIVLNHPTQGLFLDKMVWHEMLDFTKDTVLLVIASHAFDESDYIREYETFISLNGKEV